MTKIRRRGIARLVIAAGAVGAVLIGACAEKKGALMLAINTDMKAPKDVNAVSVTISTNGAIKHSFIGRVTPQGDVLLPATLAIVEPDDASASIRVRVMAFQDRKPRVLRDVRTTVPSGGRTALLRIPLNFVNDASAVGEALPAGLVPDPLPGTGAPGNGGSSGTSGGLSGGAADFDFFGAFQPPCADIQNQTIIEGECRDNFIDPATLPDFDESALGDSTNQQSCFDLARCFATAVDGEGTGVEPPKDAGADATTSPRDASTPPEGGLSGDGGKPFKNYVPAAVTLDRTNCTLQLNGANPARLNLAIVTTDTGECVRPGECYVPIDRGPGGWIESGGRVQLPPFVCKLLNGKNLRLATAAETCAAKEESNPICRAAVSGPGGGGGPCTELTIGSPVGPAIGGSAASQVGVQATSDYAASAGAAVTGITASCKKIAQDLDAPKDRQDAAEASADSKAKMKAWCELATSAMTTMRARAGGTLSVQTPPSICRLSVSAKAACQGRCAASPCDIKANPPRCTGGSLLIACKGACTSNAGADVKCEGTCAGACRGSCTAPGGVECDGKCTGACTASGAGSGLQADGSCKGSCKGVCSFTAPAATCAGDCNGACSASCDGNAQKAVKCDGVCAADFDPLYCEGGKLEGGCKVDARCDASCDVSGAANAECPAPQVFVASFGTADMEAAAKLRAALEASYGAVLAFNSRLQGMAQLAGVLTGNTPSDIKAACIPAVAAANARAVEEVSAALSALTTLRGAVGGDN